MFALPGQLNQALNPDTQAEEEEERLGGRQSELDGQTERKERKEKKEFKDKANVRRSWQTCLANARWKTGAGRKKNKKNNNR